MRHETIFCKDFGIMMLGLYLVMLRIMQIAKGILSFFGYFQEWKGNVTNFILIKVL
jgi:hypothetical protein